MGTKCPWKSDRYCKHIPAYSCLICKGSIVVEWESVALFLRLRCRRLELNCVLEIDITRNTGHSTSYVPTMCWFYPSMTEKLLTGIIESYQTNEKTNQ